VNRWALLRALLWLMSAALLTAAAWRGYGRARPNERHLGTEPAMPVSPQPSLTADSLSTLANRIVSADAFRIVRRPSPILFGSAADAGAASAPKPPKPALVLSGIIGGPPWIGVVDGVPGHDQSVLVHPGDSIAGLRIQRVTKTLVLIVGLDTTWRLTVHQPWP
jgi:hypothetical protein